MTTSAIGTYAFPAADSAEKFHGNIVLYVGWDDHLMFCAPFAYQLPPDTPFKVVRDQVLPGDFSYHPDFKEVDWSKAEWFKSGTPWHPDIDKSLAENGLKHKDVLRLRTPGLKGIKGSSS